MNTKARLNKWRNLAAVAYYNSVVTGRLKAEYKYILRLYHRELAVDRPVFYAPRRRIIQAVRSLVSPPFFTMRRPVRVWYECGHTDIIEKAVADLGWNYCFQCYKGAAGITEGVTHHG